ncbi:MAG: ABC transporter permease [Clostridia bacterium]|nr:ABC transporter permease [Clostridia bacterium]
MDGLKERWKYILKSTGKRAVSVISIVLGITFIAFSLSYLCPGDPITLQLEAMGVAPTEEIVSAMKADKGLDKPFLVQYGNWVKGLVTGDLGTSVVTGGKISDDMFRYLPDTLLLTFVSLLTTMAVSIVLGILCAVYANSILDYIIRFITYFFAAFPNFFLALLMLWFFGISLGWFPIIASEHSGGMVMPVMLLTLVISASYTRQIRAIVLEQLSSDYIAGCKARGVPFKTILFKHVLRNSLVPIITMVGISFGGMLGGTAIVENIFTWRGMGLYAIKSIQKLDYTVIQAYVAWMSVIYLAVNLMVDIVCAMANPRTRSLAEEEA